MFTFRINGKKHQTDSPTMSVRELLRIAEKNDAAAVVTEQGERITSREYKLTIPGRVFTTAD